MTSAPESNGLLSPPASRQRKLNATAALARQAVRHGERVRVLNAEPDDIEPVALARVADPPVYSLESRTHGFARRFDLALRFVFDGSAGAQIVGARVLRGVGLPQRKLRGHGLLHSRPQTSIEPLRHAHTHRGSCGETTLRRGTLSASYIHFHLPSHSPAAAALLIP